MLILTKFSSPFVDPITDLLDEIARLLYHKEDFINQEQGLSRGVQLQHRTDGHTRYQCLAGSYYTKQSVIYYYQ